MTVIWSIDGYENSIGVLIMKLFRATLNISLTNAGSSKKSGSIARTIVPDGEFSMYYNLNLELCI